MIFDDGLFEPGDTADSLYRRHPRELDLDAMRPHPRELVELTDRREVALAHYPDSIADVLDLGKDVRRDEEGSATSAGVADQPVKLLLVKGIGGMAAPAGAPYLTVTVSWEDARQAMSVLKATIAVNSAGVQTTESLVGIGDEALMGPVDSMLAFVKGQTGVRIDLSQVPKGRDKGVAIARRIAGRL